MKKILFVCGSLKAGHDGVGDYTRELAGALMSLGVKCRIIAIMDRETKGFMKEIQPARDQQISVTRLSNTLSFHVRKKEYENLIDEFKPDYISLQFVPYAFSPKGIPLKLSKFLKIRNEKLKWHFMIHEGYIGNSLDFKKRIIRLIQIYILKSLVLKLSPFLIHTSIPLYQRYLADIGIDSDILGLFGNIPISQAVSNIETNQTLVGVYFGAAPQRNDFQLFADGLKEYIQKAKMKIQFVLCGKSGAEGKSFANFLRQQIPYEQFSVIEMGNMRSDDLSNLFLNSNFAIAREPPYLLGKSGSAIAMLEHGLPLWVPLAKDSDQVSRDFDFRINQCYADLPELIVSKKSFVKSSRLHEIAITFKKSLLDNN